MSDRACAKCGETKPLTAFRSRALKGIRWRGSTCRACHQAKSAEWRRANPDKVRVYNAKAKARDPEGNSRRAMDAHFKRKFGISLEERNEMLAKHMACAICERTEPTKRGWCIDHDHKTGRIRGILCAPCNSMIGLARESAHVLERAIIYVEASDACHDTL